MVVNIGTSAVNMMVERGRWRGTGFASWPVRQKTAFSPGYVGIETSQSAFGDTYAWLKRLLLWPLESLLAGSGLPQEQQNALAQQAGQQLLPLLEQAAKALRAAAGARRARLVQRPQISVQQRSGQQRGLRTGPRRQRTGPLPRTGRGDGLWPAADRDGTDGARDPD